MNAIKSEWQGTAQHSDASDLSRWLVHLTRSEADLISILKSGVIEARRAYGAGRQVVSVAARHRSVCLTEIPLHELTRMTSKRPWGLVFDKERLRVKFGAQPVWYLSDPSQEKDAIEQAMSASTNDPRAPIWTLTPLVEFVRSRQSTFPHDWRWEREWRVRGHLEFEMSDVAMVVTNDAGAPSFLEEASVGVPWTSPGSSSVEWVGGITSGWDAEIAAMLERFREAYLTPEEGGFTWDKEDQQYYGMAGLYDTDVAMDDIYGSISSELHEALSEVLSSKSQLWARAFDLSHSWD